MRARRGWIAIGCLLLAQGLMNSASANIYTVGDNTCNYTNIDDALDAAETHSGADTIRLTRTGDYTAAAITFSTSQDLTITGGFANCTTATEDSVYTILNGAGAPAASVITINGDTGSVVRLRKLTIKNGDVASTGSAGGGIQYTGKGKLDIAYSLIQNNTGAYGGGINAGGTSDAAELDIGPNTLITGNIAIYNGGGIYSNNIEAAIRGDSIGVYSNEATGLAGAGGYGGGIHIRACALISAVYLGSPGLGGNLSVVSNNTAVYGGGVAIETPSGCSKAADLRMYSTAAGLTSLKGNIASISGGGVYISRGGGTADVYVRNASIQNNTAPVASALYLGNAGNAQFNGVSGIAFGDDIVDCATGVPCGSISGNISANGQVIYGQTNNRMELNNVEVTGNQGTELVRLNDLRLYDTLVADNASTNRLLETHIGSIAFSTITGNQVGGSQVIGINMGGTFNMTGSVTWQPGKTILHNDGALPIVSDVVTSELASFSGPNSSRNLVANPRLIDPTPNGNYAPTAGSPVIDYAVGGNLLNDLLNLPRDIDLGIVDDLYGTRDVGAYERQALQPLVENGEFAANNRVWSVYNGVVTTWDATQNAPGSTGGSMHIKQSTASTDVVGAVQCIHLPGPGDYTLNGSGKVASGGGLPSNAHYATLSWELRLAGSETCTGNADLYGDKVLAATGSSWNRPSAQTHIIVSAQQWTSDTSVAVYTKINEGGGIGGIAAPTGTSLKEGWIDHVTLNVEEPVSDRIFSDGFDLSSLAPAE
ncbi:MAG: hypothetical protein ABIR27_03630 [Dokdonella sp.]